MKNKYTLIHRHRFGTSVFHFHTYKSFTEVSTWVPNYSEEPTEEQQEFLDVLGVDYNTPDEEIDILEYKEPVFESID